MDKKVIMLVGKGESSVFMYNGLKETFKVSKYIVEDKPNRKQFLKRRVKRLGYVNVLGQILFQISIPRVLKKIAKARIAEIKSNYRLDDTPVPKALLHELDSVNSTECIDLIKRENPDIVVVNGTRIISKKVLNCTDAIFINTHAGITPKYRGVHGGYWALANQDRENCGVTVHMVDSGIDTGGVLYQKKITPNANDNYATYTYHQIGEGILLMKKAIESIVNNELQEIAPMTSESKLWYHPTIWNYLYTILTKGIK